MMLKLIAAFLISLGLASAALAQSSVFVPATTNTVPILINSAATTPLVTGVPGKRIYLTSLLLVVDGGSAVSFISGDNAACTVNVVIVTGIMDFTLGAIVTMGNGYGTWGVVAPGKSLCVVTGAAVGHDGVLGYAIF